MRAFWKMLALPRMMIGVQCHFTSPHSKTKRGRTTGNFQ